MIDNNLPTWDMRLLNKVLRYFDANCQRGIQDALKIQGWFTKNDMNSYNVLMENIHDGLVVEVGSYFGRSIQSILPIAHKNDLNIIAVDLFELNEIELRRGGFCVPTVEDFLINLNYDSNVTVIQDSSIRAAELIGQTRGLLSGVFIDASHDYNSVKGDIRAWSPLVKSGGWIAGHDYCKGWPGVKEAARDVFGKDYKTLPDTIWYHMVNL